MPGDVLMIYRDNYEFTHTLIVKSIFWIKENIMLKCSSILIYLL